MKKSTRKARLSLKSTIAITAVMFCALLAIYAVLDFAQYPSRDHRVVARDIEATMQKVVDTNTQSKEDDDKLQALNSTPEADYSEKASLVTAPINFIATFGLPVILYFFLRERWSTKNYGHTTVLIATASTALAIIIYSAVQRFLLGADLSAGGNLLVSGASLVFIFLINLLIISIVDAVYKKRYSLEID